MTRDEPSIPAVPAAAVAAAWCVVAISWGPAAALVVSGAPSLRAVAVSTGLSLLSFLPWAIATPALFALCRHHPLGVGRDLRSLAGLLASGLVTVPLLVALAPLMEAGIDAATGAFGGAVSIARLPRRLMISALFSVPTFVAVIAVGQTLVWAARARAQATLAAKSELRAIRAELSPHFTVNALGAIAQLAHVSAERAEAAARSLANVLRSSLSDEGDEYTLADELGALEAHLDLFRHVTGGAAFRREVDDGAWGWRMPRHVLVPLLENALTHGVPDPEGLRSVTLRATLHADVLTVTIENATGDRAAPSSGLGLGLRQVVDRLRLVYGSRAALATASINGRFRATVSVPRA